MKATIKLLEIIQKEIMKHTILMDRAVEVSMNLLNMAKNEDIDILISEIHNRTRLINLLELLQEKIECYFDQFLTQEHSKQTNEYLISVLTSWNYDFHSIIKKIDLIDQKTLEMLGKNKEKLSLEISSIFQNKMKHKGYQLNSSKA
jgi:hypothetical protein